MHLLFGLGESRSGVASCELLQRALRCSETVAGIFPTKQPMDSVGGGL